MSRSRIVAAESTQIPDGSIVARNERRPERGVRVPYPVLEGIKDPLNRR
jgi:hypothetical protein